MEQKQELTRHDGAAYDDDRETGDVMTNSCGKRHVISVELVQKQLVT